MKTTWAKADSEKKWYLVDANDKILGRLATRIAMILMGKNKPVYTPFMDTGDFVVVVNAEKIKVTGKKLTDKVYYAYSGYFGGLKEKTLEQMLDRKPEEVIRLAVKRMLPKNRLGRQMLKKLKIYSGSEHPHSAQQPEKIEF
ncbi:50S ribosomal protein L13 [Deferribacteraceae bacterium V6Fe1]|jgi:large subunit ribosomal protein L13|uniref:50S ribosomal protein L13 n=1 Tax=Deferrivibrio essentukiensis TaxID=2880922 RepID=UPI0019C8FBB3|nr:50S ribosomal protein L13 [Deferrivibrio essentukiensis]MBC7195855.1 50S ribosomal protein L13 [Deferribacterales bacterium]MCB4203714.1 50S ribosomal protein L13 [Deferrivibrio essentukiensis]UOD35013.1 50S ribosomal protein L13 [Deferribacteraceae bacterium V6Fe1]